MLAQPRQRMGGRVECARPLVGREACLDRVQRFRVLAGVRVVQVGLPGCQPRKGTVSRT